MKMELTEQQSALLNRRKSNDLTLQEFLEVTLLQVEIQMYRTEKFIFREKIENLRDRIQKVSGTTLMQEIGSIQRECNEMVQEIMKQ